MTKLEKAEQTALTAIPARISFAEVAFPPMFAMACEIPSSVYSGRNRSGFLPDSLSQYPAAYVPVILFTSQQFNYADTDSNIPVFQLQP